MMERLTFDGNFCDIAQCTSTPGGSFCEDGSCSARKVWERLKAYEDTELAPEMCANYKTFEDEAISKGVTFKRIVALMEADRAGRLVVLPCKVGDMVYVINRHLGQIFASTVISINVGNSTDLKNYIRTKWVGEKGNESIRMWTLRQVGRYVFLTREEAEKALEAKRDGSTSM